MKCYQKPANFIADTKSEVKNFINRRLLKISVLTFEIKINEKKTPPDNSKSVSTPEITL